MTIDKHVRTHDQFKDQDLNDLISSIHKIYNMITCLTTGVSSVDKNGCEDYD